MSAEKRTGNRWRLFSLETILGLAAVLLIAGGIFAGHVMAIFWGAATAVGLVVLQLMRRKDWQAHWDEKNRQQPQNREDR